MNIAQLKSKILDLAVRGKLTEQDEHDKCIDLSVIKQKKIDFCFEIPNNWSFVHLEAITKSISSKPYQILESQVLLSGKFPVISQAKEYSIGFSNDEKKVLYHEHPLVLFGDHTTEVKLVKSDFIVGADGIKIFEPIRSVVSAEFLYYVLQFYTINLSKNSGYTRHYKYIKNKGIPLPPLAEQKRIVEKIEAIFKQADIIEAKRLALKTAVRHTKSRVLDLAVRGKLTEQRPEEGSAEELLERIREEKQRLIAEGKLKKEKPLPEITEEEIPFDIPAGWKWVTGKDIFYPMSSCKPQGESFRYIDIESIDNKKHKIKNARTILSTHAPSRASRFIEEGNVLFSLVRPYLQNIAYVDKEFSDCIASTGFFVCRAKQIIYPKYMYFLMLSKYVIDGLNSFMKGDNSPSINCDNIFGFLFPLPPFVEQKRIVEKIEQIFGILDTIEKMVEG